MYETPTPEELQVFMAENDLTGIDVAALTGAGDRTVWGWLTPKGQKGFRAIPWTAWILLNILLGKTDRRKLLKEIGKWKKEKSGRGLFERGIGGKPRREIKPKEE